MTIFGSKIKINGVNDSIHEFCSYMVNLTDGLTNGEGLYLPSRRLVPFGALFWKERGEQNALKG